MSNKIVLSNLWDGNPAQFSKKHKNYEIEFKFNLETSDMLVIIDAPYFDDPVPVTSNKSYRCEQLSNYEVVEVFIASGIFDIESRDNYYVELEVGPHGHYYVCTFPGEGAWSEKNDNIFLEHSPITRIDRDNMRWHCEVSIPCYLIPEPFCGDDYHMSMSSTWMMNAFAIHGQGAEEREYLAYSPVPIDSSRSQQPNFHQLCAFTPITINELFNDLTSDETNDIHSDTSEDEVEYDSITDTAPTTSLDTASSASPNTTKSAKKVSELQFRPSTWDPEAKKRAALKQAALQTPDSTVITVAEIARRLKAKFNQPEIGEQFKKNLFDEEIILYGEIIKRSGWSYKKRMLLLTSKPRLIYLKIKASPNVKGIVPWTMTRPITVTKVDDTHFDISLFDDKRVFHIHDGGGGADRWIEAINAITTTWGAYLKSSVGKRIDLRMLADSLKTPA